MAHPRLLPPARRAGRSPIGRALVAWPTATVIAVAAGCTATYDWREVRPPGAGLRALLPCRPGSTTRQVALAGAQVTMAMHACSAGGQTWALSEAPLGDPARVGTALLALRAAAAANLGAGPGSPLPLDVPGATPNAAGGREQLQGRRPDGQAVLEQLGVFAYGTTVVQATVLGETMNAEAADTFFASLRVGP